MKKLLIITALLALLAAPAWAMDVRLACDPNSESDLAAYRIYWSEIPGQYSAGQMLEFPVSGLADPQAPEFLVPGLDETKTWYFVATAYDTEGLESGYSNEVSVAWDGVTGIQPTPPGGLKPVQIIITRPDGTVITLTVP